MTETENQFGLEHENIVRMIEFNAEGKWTQGSNTKSC